MEAFIVDWLGLIGRWLHLVVGIAWIGASFYFVWLDGHLEVPKEEIDRDQGVSGELWSVHGGGFYQARKYSLTPPRLPATLHWFKWEAYSTWLSGIFLLALIYWYGAQIYLIDPRVADLSQTAAVSIGIGTLVLGWIVYDLLCKSALGRHETWLAVAVLVFVSVVAWGLCHLFSGRGAYIHYGAMLGTIMVANVARVIIPGQRELVAAAKAGRRPDPIHGLRGKQRSVHNTYFTLPVLFVMISNHYPIAFTGRYNWLVLIALSLAGALVRVYFVARHRGRASMLPLAATAAIVLALAIATFPRTPSTSDGRDLGPVDIATVAGIVKQRCAPCHSASPSQPGFTTAPKGVMLDSRAQILANAARIYRQAVASKAMPIGNLTGITDTERQILAKWYRSKIEPGQ